METSTRFSCTEISLVITNCIISKLFLIYPMAFSALAGSCSILLALCTVISGIIIVYITSRLYKNRRKDITALLKGSVSKLIISILLVIIFVVNQSLFVRTVAENLKVSVLPSSPVCFITLIFLLGVMLCAFTGLKCIVRAHSFVVPFTLITLVVLFVSSIPNFEFHYIFPIFGNGFGMFNYLFMLTAYFADLLLLFFLIPFTTQDTNFNKVAKFSMITSSIVLIAVIGMYTLIIPYKVSDTFFIPIYRISQYINYESFLSRLESVFTACWLLCFFAQTSVYLYISSMICGRILKRNSTRPIILCITILIFVLSAIPKNTAQLVEWSNYFSAPRFIVFMTLPIIILSFEKVREAKRK